MGISVNEWYDISLQINIVRCRSSHESAMRLLQREIVTQDVRFNNQVESRLRL